MTGWLAVGEAAAVAALAVAAVLLGGPLVTWVFRTAEKPPKAATAESAETSPQAIAPLTRAATVLRGGQWIGMLERLAVFATVLAGFPEGIAVAMVLKGFARYPELKASSAGAAERFIIGTFVSVLFGCACAGIAAWLVRLI